jgi:ribosomal-protein-alanine N-acetyltransferase
VNGGLRIENGSVADLPSVMHVMERAFDPSFGEAWNASQCLGVLGLPGVWLLVATIGDDAVGFALSRKVVDEAELLLVAVDPEHRGAGVGRGLLGRVLADAAAAGVRRVHLEMREGNPAEHLYDKFGFAEVGRRRDYYRGRDGQRLDARTLSCDLGVALRRER